MALCCAPRQAYFCSGVEASSTTQSPPVQRDLAEKLTKEGMFIMATALNEHSTMIRTCCTSQFTGMMGENSTRAVILVLWIWWGMQPAGERTSRHSFLWWKLNCGSGFRDWNADQYRSVNIPWPGSGHGDADYLYAFQKIVMPIAYEFAPDLVISEFATPHVQRVAPRTS